MLLKTIAMGHTCQGVVEGKGQPALVLLGGGVKPPSYCR